MKNYFNLLMDDSFDLLMEDKIEWPHELTEVQKIGLMTQALNYYVSVEDYEKCALLRDKIELVKNPPKRRGRPKGSKNKK
jgi:hypothetical protein